MFESKKVGRGWQLLVNEDDRIIDVVPFLDTPEHTTSKCWCSPRVSPAENNWQMKVHYSSDDRETIEKLFRVAPNKDIK